MTGHIQLPSSVQIKKRGTVIFGDNNKGKVIGTGMVGNISKSLIENVLLVRDLKHNLLSLSLIHI